MWLAVFEVLLQANEGALRPPRYMRQRATKISGKTGRVWLARAALLPDSE